MADFNTSKVDGDTVDASEWNQLASIDNLITTSGQTPSTSNLNQTAIAAARYSSAGQYYTDGGTANAYVLSPVSPFKSPVSSGSGEGYFNGMMIRFRAGNANSGASTVNVNSAGVKNLKQADGTTDLAAGDISTTQDSEFRYNGTVFVLQSSKASIALMVYRNTNQNIGTSTTTKVQLNTATVNSGSYFDTSTNYRWTPPAGRYFVSYGAKGIDAGTSPQGLTALLYLNGSNYQSTIQPYFDNGDATVSSSVILDMNGTDYLELFASIGGTGATNISGDRATFMAGYRIS